MLSRIKSLIFGSAAPAPALDQRRALGVIRARYDAALITDNNRRHWANADALSANAANSPDVRRKLRNNSRYEVANNSYAHGIVLTLANDCIGTGPRLQMLLDDEEANGRIEDAFAAWTASVGFAEKLRTLRLAKAIDGEAFAVLINNPRLANSVKLDLRLVEADQVTTPVPTANLRAVDGILFDEFNNPVEYHVLKTHPGDALAAATLEFDRVPARLVLHYYRAVRPGQSRGIPELTAALPLFALLREYTLATLDAAKAAAYVAGILYTDAPANGEAADLEPMDPISLERNTLLTVPGGWKMGQVHAEQPASSFAEFKREILNEVARGLNMPFNIAAGNSSGYNYASGRLDHQTYFKSIHVEQSAVESALLDRIFTAWLGEAALIEGLLPQSARHSSLIPTHQWFWDGFEHVDPAKEATAQEIRLRNHTTTLADEHAKRGQDWQVQLRQRAKEVALMNELGLEPAQAVLAPTSEPNDGN